MRLKQLACVAATLALSLASAAYAGDSEPAHACGDAAAKLHRFVDDQMLPGAHLVVAQNGERLVSTIAGFQDVETATPLDEATIYRLYSMTKPITSVAIMILAEEGRLALDDPLSDYLPAFKDMRVYQSGSVDDMTTVPADRPITIADLLAHRSGIAYHFTGNTPVHQLYRKNGIFRATPVGRPAGAAPAEDLDQLVLRIADAPLLFQPGTQFEYSYSTTVLGAVIEAVSGQSLDAFIEQRVLRPLDMKDTGFFIADEDLNRFVTGYGSTDKGIEVIEATATSDYRDRNRLLDGGGGMVGTMEDYLHLTHMLANGGVYRGTRILSEASVAEMFETHIVIDDFAPYPMPFGYGFAIGTADSEAAGIQPAGTGSWAGSANTYFLVDPESNMSAVLMTHVITPPVSARTDDFRRTLTETMICYRDR